MKPWRLTPQAEDALVDIARWTLDRFGAAQMVADRDELLDRCDAVAKGQAVTQDCSALTGDPAAGLRFVRAGGHFAVFVDLGHEIVFVDVLHGRSDLPRHLAALAHAAPD